MPVAVLMYAHFIFGGFIGGPCGDAAYFAELARAGLLLLPTPLKQSD